jgi:flagellar basal body-associated protein FliL
MILNTMLHILLVMFLAAYCIATVALATTAKKLVVGHVKRERSDRRPDQPLTYGRPAHLNRANFDAKDSHERKGRVTTLPRRPTQFLLEACCCLLV